MKNFGEDEAFQVILYALKTPKKDLILESEEDVYGIYLICRNTRTIANNSFFFILKQKRSIICLIDNI